MIGERNEAGTKTSFAEKERGRNENVIYGKGTRQERKHESRGTTNTLDKIQLYLKFFGNYKLKAFKAN